MRTELSRVAFPDNDGLALTTIFYKWRYQRLCLFHVDCTKTHLAAVF